MKEILNNLLHKKLSEQQERDLEVKTDGESPAIKQETEETRSSVLSEKQEGCGYEDVAIGDSVPVHGVTLQEILNEKKKLLLRNTDVVKFLEGKMNK